jgi:hypothetical protein
LPDCSRCAVSSDGRALASCRPPILAFAPRAARTENGRPWRHGWGVGLWRRSEASRRCGDDRESRWAIVEA